MLLPRSYVRTFAPALLAAVLGACGAPAQAPAPPSPAPLHSAADVTFMRHMIVHHAQAVELSALVEGRAADPRIRLLAERITVSQADEMAQMRRWLLSRGEAVPDEHAHHSGEHASMPGMATAADIAALAGLRGAAFDRRFLELMIHHHEGALVMVAELFASERGGQESETYQFASEVESDQRMEIDRMRRMQQDPNPTPERNRG